MCTLRSFTEYQQQALRTEKTPIFYGNNHTKSRVAHGIIGILTEVGELQDAVKRHVIYGKPLDVVNLMEECGDIGWYTTLLCSALDVDMSQFDDLFFRNTGTVWQSRQAGELLDQVLTMGEHAGVLQKFCHDIEPVGAGLKAGAHADAIRNILGACAAVLNIGGWVWGHACDRNIAKLSARYPEKFTQEAALNRNLGAERAALEGRGMSGLQVSDEARAALAAQPTIAEVMATPDPLTTPEGLTESIDRFAKYVVKAAAGACCERDIDGDGNGDRHPAAERKA